MVKIVNELNPIITAFLLAVAMLAGWGIAWRTGRSLQGESREASSSKFNDAILALLGLLLAFTFSMSLVKHEQRRQMVVTDSNAIGDFYTSASFLAEPTRGELRSLVRTYAEHRLSLADHSTTEEHLQNSLGKIRQMHSQMELLVKEGIRTGTPVAAPLLNTLNALTSSHASRLAAVHDRLPPNILLLLALAAILSNSLMGMQQGVTSEWRLGATVGFTVLVCMVIWVTLDLNQPRRGWITVSQEPLEQLLKGMD